MKKNVKNAIKYIIAIIISLLLLESCGKSPVGTYTADLTLLQSGSMTTIVLNSNGSATMTQDGFETEYTYWDYAGKGIDVRIHTDTGYWYFMDFDEGMIYFGADNYRSCRNGHIFHKK